MAPGIYEAKDGRIGRVSRVGSGYVIKWNDGSTTAIGDVR